MQFVCNPCGNHLKVAGNGHNGHFFLFFVYCVDTMDRKFPVCGTGCCPFRTSFGCGFTPTEYFASPVSHPLISGLLSISPYFLIYVSHFIVQLSCNRNDSGNMRIVKMLCGHNRSNKTKSNWLLISGFRKKTFQLSIGELKALVCRMSWRRISRNTTFNNIRLKCF